ncbi:hypothetical protein EZS27_007386 [termite gut metagenome]|uniref:Lipoprotein n=1 Tax=termite gut metagenome TaxID=433724 RepID=A0A5J4SI50_9ZZZZ
MKTIKTILILILPVLVFSACRSSKSMQREIRMFHSDLYYELTTPDYLGEINQTVYLNFIDYSNIDYHTTVKKKGMLIVPLLFFNYWWKEFNVVLGESSLTQTYREFLTEALLTECNSSTCFNLTHHNTDIIPDSAYVLDIKIVHNRTTSAIKLSETVIFLPFDTNSHFDMNFSNCKVQPAISDLYISVRLTRENDCLLEKTYPIHQKLSYAGGGLENSPFIGETCLNTMTECLSVATKKVVEDISSELHLLMLGR